MLTNLAKRSVSVVGVGETRAFTIKANGKAFKALIDGLYSDKIRAVIRELCTNAYDAHVSIGTPEVPFECCLPTVFEPTFSVRDFGVSLCHEDVMGLYTTVFESTKDGGNAHVGKFGLGSKSPFAYVDTFSVTTWLNGEKRTYSAYIGEDYVPQIALMSCDESDEPQGLEVAFPCQADDVDAFAAAASKVALGFDVPPTLTGRVIDFEPLETVMDDAPLWRLVKSDHSAIRRYTAYARQGCVVYPIDADAIPGISEVQAAILRSPFFIDFPIGDLEIATNREALGYDERTCRNVLRAVDLIAAEVRTRFEKEIAGCQTYWEACRRLVELQNSGIDESARKVLLAGGLNWRGRKLHDTISLHKAMERAHKSIVTAGGAQGLHLSRSSLQRRRAIKWESSSYITVHPATTAIYLEDVTKRISLPGPRIRFHFDKSNTQDLAWFKADPNSLNWKRLLAVMGRPPVILINDLERPPVDKSYGMRAPVQMKVLPSGRYYRTKMDTAVVQEDDDVIYFRMERGDIVGSKHEVSISYTQEVRDFLRAQGLIPADAQIVGVPKSLAKRIDRNPHWRCIWDVAKDAIDKNFVPKDAARAEACQDVVTDGRLAFISALHAHGLMPASVKGACGRLLSLFVSVKARADAVDVQRAWYAFAQKVNGGETKLPRYNVAWEKWADAFDETYPMVRLAVGHRSGFNDDERKAMLDYVNLVDASR